MSLLNFSIYLFLAIVQYSLCNEKMDASEDPILQFLQLNTDSQPQHEFVKIELLDRLHKRSFSKTTMPAGMRMRIRAFGDNVDLWLHPRDSLLASSDTPVYYSRYSLDSPGNVSIAQRYNLMKTLGTILEDPKHLASLIIGTDNYGRMTVNGRIGSKRLAVRSLPESVVNEYARKRRTIDDLDKDFLNSTHHVVYRINDDLEENYIHGALNQTMLRERVARSTSGIPYIFFPKVLVVVDYSIYKEQGRDINRFLEYLLAFLNGIDLKYRELETPRVRFHIAAILVGTDPKAIPYISDHMLGDKAFKSGSAMADSAYFFHKIKDSISLSMFDIALTMTRLDFGVGENALVVGKGYLGYVCKNLTSQKMMLATAMVRDNGGFSGVSTAAHELGHVLGMNHDEVQSEDCTYTNGFIMAVILKHTSNSTSFSKCSVMELQQRLEGVDGVCFYQENLIFSHLLRRIYFDVFAYFLRPLAWNKNNPCLCFDLCHSFHTCSQSLRCMYRAPRQYGRTLPKLMPGRIVSREEQCKLHDLGVPCNDSNADDCVNLYCRESDGNCRKVDDSTLEGTRCSAENETSERFCVHSQCVRV